MTGIVTFVLFNCKINNSQIDFLAYILLDNE